VSTFLKRWFANSKTSKLEQAIEEGDSRKILEIGREKWGEIWAGLVIYTDRVKLICVAKTGEEAEQQTDAWGEKTVAEFEAGTTPNESFMLVSTNILHPESAFKTRAAMQMMGMSGEQITAAVAAMKQQLITILETMKAKKRDH